MSSLGVTYLALHRANCRDECCAWCQDRAETRKEAADEPLTTHEQAARDTWAERSLGL